MNAFGGDVVETENGYGMYQNGVFAGSSDAFYHNMRFIVTNAEEKDRLISAGEAEGKETGIGLALCPGWNEKGESHDATFYLDSIAVSKPGIELEPGTSYDFLSGTSMATPAVCGAGALLASLYPRQEGESGSDYAKRIRAKLFSCVRQTEELKELCSTGGYVDLSLLETGEPAIIDAVCDLGNEAIILTGENLYEGSTVTYRRLAVDGAQDQPLPQEMTVEYAADVDVDGEVTILDAIAIQRLLAGLPSAFDPQAPDYDALYKRAVRDAMIIEEDDIMPLVNITKDDDRVIWDGDRVLVAFMHKYPDSYPAGEDITLKWGNVWCVSAGEMIDWVNDNAKDVDDWSFRLHQLLGMPASKGYTTITAVWVDADLLYRPANVTDPTAEMKTAYQPTGDKEIDNMYKSWFDSNIIWSYFDSAYPWTRLGYSYDWADNGTAYGLSEFLIFSGADATVEYTMSIDDFVAYEMQR